MKFEKGDFAGTGGETVSPEDELEIPRQIYLGRVSPEVSLGRLNKESPRTTKERIEEYEE